jgi:hypothetical protein
MTLEIKITDIENAMEKTFDGGNFESFEQELEYVNDKYKADYLHYCKAKEKEWLDSDEYIPDDADFIERLKIEFVHLKHIIKRIFRGDIYEQESKDEWVIPYDSINDTMYMSIHIPSKEWKRLRRKWDV